MRHKRTPPSPNPDSVAYHHPQKHILFEPTSGTSLFFATGHCPDKKDKPLTDKEGCVLVRKEISTDWLGKRLYHPKWGVKAKIRMYSRHWPSS
jgi:hypothetical protein